MGYDRAHWSAPYDSELECSDCQPGGHALAHRVAHDPVGAGVLDRPFSMKAGPCEIAKADMDVPNLRVAPISDGSFGRLVAYWRQDGRTRSWDDVRVGCAHPPVLRVATSRTQGSADRATDLGPKDRVAELGITAGIDRCGAASTAVRGHGDT